MMLRVCTVFFLLFLPLNSNLYAEQSAINGNEFSDVSGHILITGSFTFTTSVILCRFFPDMKPVPKYLISSVVGLTPGTIKEIKDKDAVGYWETDDIIYNFIGAGTGVLLQYLLFDMKRNKHQASLNYHPKLGVNLAYNYRF